MRRPTWRAAGIAPLRRRPGAPPWIGSGGGARPRRPRGRCVQVKGGGGVAAGARSAGCGRGAAVRCQLLQDRGGIWSGRRVHLHCSEMSAGGKCPAFLPPKTCVSHLWLAGADE